MKFDIYFIEKIKLELAKPLPGEPAQYSMAPAYRPRLTSADIQAMLPKISGVMLLLYVKNDELHIAFTQRRTYEGVHSGQMSLPGGKREEQDTDLIKTALRETQEEIGVPHQNIEILGNLTELYIPPSNYLVHPVVGFLPTAMQFIPQEKEVEKIVEIPISFFMNTENVNLQTEITVQATTTVMVPAYIFEQHIIWGATAIILSEFVAIINSIAE